MDRARDRLRVNHVFGAGEGHNLRVLDSSLAETHQCENMFFLRILLFWFVFYICTHFPFPTLFKFQSDFLRVEVDQKFVSGYAASMEICVSHMRWSSMAEVRLIMFFFVGIVIGLWSCWIHAWRVWA